MVENGLREAHERQSIREDVPVCLCRAQSLEAVVVVVEDQLRVCDRPSPRGCSEVYPAVHLELHVGGGCSLPHVPARVRERDDVLQRRQLVLRGPEAERLAIYEDVLVALTVYELALVVSPTQAHHFECLLGVDGIATCREEWLGVDVDDVLTVTATVDDGLSVQLPFPGRMETIFVCRLGFEVRAQPPVGVVAVADLDSYETQRRHADGDLHGCPVVTVVRVLLLLPLVEAEVDDGS